MTNRVLQQLICNPPDMEACLAALLMQIPIGRVTTHGDLAMSLGSPTASRWVGHYVLHHDHGERCNCHRVVRASGELGGHVSGDPRIKEMLLRAEGVVVTDGKLVLDDYRHDDFNGKRPLLALQTAQESLSGETGVAERRATTSADRRRSRRFVCE